MTLRGGGCASIVQTRQSQVKNVIEENSIQLFIKGISQRCESIHKCSTNIGLQQGQQQILEELKWFSLCSQYINQINRSDQMVQNNIILFLRNLGILLDSTINILQSQKYLGLQLLKICNSFSRLIFIYYINNPNSPMKEVTQQQLQQKLRQIEIIEDANSYSNSIIYEYTLIRMCIDTCPTDSQRGQEILINSFKGVISSILKMSPSTELLKSLVEGALYLYNENQNQSKKKQFRIILYIEELKWQIIEQVQNGRGIKKILDYICQHYKELIENSDEWIIKCSWIKIVSEIIIYQPIISKQNYDTLANQFEVLTKWEELIQNNIIKLVHADLAVIQEFDANSYVGRLFQSQITKFDQIRIAFLEGNQVMKQFNNLIEVNKQNPQNFHQIVQVQQCLENIPINLIIIQYEEILKYQQDYYELIIFNKVEKEVAITILEQLITLNIVLEKKSQQSMIVSSIIYIEIGNLFKNYQMDKLVKEATGKYIILLITRLFILIQQDNDILIVDVKQSYINIQQQLKIYNFDKFFSDELMKQIHTKIQQSEDYNQIITYLDKEIKITLQSIESDPSLILICLDFLDHMKQKYLYEIIKSLNIQQILLQCVKQGDDKLFIEQIKNYNEELLLFSILIKLVITLYKDINKFLNEYLFNEQQLKEFQPIQLQDLTLFNTRLISERLRYLKEISNKFIEYINYNESLLELNNLKRSKHILNLYENQILQYQNLIGQQQENFRQVIQNIKQNDQKQIIFQQMIENYEKLIKLSKKQSDTNSSLDLKQLIDERIKLIQILQSKYISNIQIAEQTQLELNYYQTIFIDGFEQQIEEFSHDLINIIEDHYKKLLNLLEDNKIELKSQQNQDQSQFLQIVITQYDQLLKQTRSQKILTQRQEIQLIQQDINKVVFQITSCKYQNKQYDDDRIHQLDQQKNKILNDVSNIIQDLTNLNLNQTPIEDICKQFGRIKDLSRENYEILVPIDYHKNQQQSQNKQQKIGFIQQIKDVIYEKEWRIKEYFYFNCLQIYSQTQNSKVKQVIGQIILYGRFKEVHFRVLLTLKNKEFIDQMEQLVNFQWSNLDQDIKMHLQLTLNQLQQIQLQMQSEEKKVEREKLIQQHKQLEQQLEQQMKNIKEIGDILGVTIHFLKDIKRELTLIQQKLEAISQQIDQIGQDLKFLRGKSCQQLLEIRMEQILQNKFIQDSQSVYVEIEVKKFNFALMKEDNISSFLFNSENNGEIYKFINQNNFTSLLLHGQAGAGKSISAKRIEEQLWLQYSKTAQNQLWDQLKQIPLIPIFVQLPTIKEPKFLAIEESLQQLYRFDQKQIDQLKEQVQQGIIKLIFIFDSYDELSNQYQGVNLIKTNKINQWKPKNDINNPKIITTSRTEAFTKLEYRSWFYDNTEQGQQSFIEYRLLPFNNNQISDFLEQFSLLQLLLKIKDLLEIITKQKQQDILISNALQIINQVKMLISNQKHGGFLLNNSNSLQIVQNIRDHPNVISLNQEQEQSFLKTIRVLWNKEQYQKCILQMELKQILETPFMMKIIVEVLPLMNERISSLNHINRTFKQSYVKYKEQQLRSIISFFKCKEIQSIYNEEEILQLENILKQKQYLVQEATNIWEYLIESNFFNNFNALYLQEEIIQAISAMKLNSMIKFPQITAGKERDIDNHAIIIRALRNRSQNMNDFFEVFMNHFIENQREKLIYAEINDQNQFQQDIKQYAVQLAVLMTTKNETVIERKLQGLLYNDQAIQDDYQNFFNDQDQYANYRKLIRKCLPIKQKANFYQFQHKSIQEYLFSTNVTQLLELVSNDSELKEEVVNCRRDNKMKLKNSYIIQKIKESPLNLVKIDGQFLQGAIRFLILALQSSDQMQEACYQLILLSSIDDSFINLSSNLFYLYANVKQFIWDTDFSKIKISNIPLDGKGFLNCNLSQSSFNNVSLNGINLNFSNLQQATWINCITDQNPVFVGPDNIQVLSLCYSQDNQYIMSGSSDGFIRIWDNQQFILVQQFQTNLKNVQYLELWKQNLILSIGDMTGGSQVVKVWDLNSYKQIGEDLQIFYNKQIKLLSHNSSHLVIGDSNNNITVYDINLNKTHQIQLQSTVAIQFKSQTQEIYIFNYKESYIYIWDLSIDKVQKSAEMMKFYDVHYYFTDDCTILVAQCKHNLTFNQTKQGTKDYVKVTYYYKVKCFQISQGKKYMVLQNHNNDLIITDINNASKQLYSIMCQTVNCIAFNQNNTQFSTASGQIIKQYELNLKQSIRKLQKKDYLHDIIYSQDGLQIFYFTNYRIQICDAYTGNDLDTINIHAMNMVFNLDGKQLLIETTQDHIIYDLGQRKITKQYKLQSGKIVHSNGQMICIKFQYLAYMAEADFVQICYFNEDFSQILAQNEVEALLGKVSYNNQFFYYTSRDYIYGMNIRIEQASIKLSDIGIRFKHQNNITDFVIRSDDNQLVSICENLLYVWDLKQKIELHKFEFDNFLVDVKFSLNNDHLIIAESYYILVIETNTFKQVGDKLTGHQNDLAKIIVSPNGQQFISFSKDECFKIWDINRKDTMKQAYIERFMIPQIQNPDVLINESNLEGAQIKSLQGYNLLDIWKYT